MTGERVVLWHLAMSHYNEKARWALEYKRVPHARRAVMPGVHIQVAQRLGGRQTMPVLVIGDHVFPDSTEIVAALEERWPEPPLYPGDPVERAEALALEEHLDEVLAPAIRQVAYQRLLQDPDAAAAFLGFGGPPLRTPLVRAMMGPLRTAIRSTFGVPEPGDPGPREAVLAVLDELGERLDGREFLVGDRFSVADLSACSYLSLLVAADAMPAAPPLPDIFADLRAAAMQRPAGAWASQTYRAWRTA